MKNDVGAERAVLAGLAQFGVEAYIDLSEIISHNSFSDRNNQLIYRCMEKAINSGQEIDLQSILSAAEQLNITETINTDQELAYIRSLFQFPVSRGNIDKFAVQIKKFELAKQIVHVSELIKQDAERINGDESITDIVGMLEEPVIRFLREEDSKTTRELMGEGLDEYIEDLINNPRDQIGIPSGFPRFDASIGGGLRRKCVDVVSARPKAGKSSFAENVALHVSNMGIPVLLLDTEMSKEDHIHRSISKLSKVHLGDIPTGKFGKDENKVVDVLQAKEIVKSLPYYYTSVAGRQPQEILNEIKRWIVQVVGTDDEGNTNDCLVIYDYLKLMDLGNGKLKEYEILGQQITDLHNLTVKYDFPCLAFVQLNRDGETQETTSVVAGSDRIIWLCTSFSILKPKSETEAAADGPNMGSRKLRPIVARHGPAMPDGNYINMEFRGEYCHIDEICTRDEMIHRMETEGAIEGATEFGQDEDS